MTHVNTGSNLVLTCMVDTGPLIPQYILWYKENQIIAYSESIKAKVFTTMATNGTGRPHQSEMVIRNVSDRDSGHYRCDSDLTDEASITVYVVEEDLKSLYSGKKKFKAGGGGTGRKDLPSSAVASSSAAGNKSYYSSCCCFNSSLTRLFFFSFLISKLLHLLQLPTAAAVLAAAAMVRD